jgi:guanylate kinase
MIVILGISASGKTTVANEIMNTYKMNKIITTTTRLMRLGEVNGVDYDFITTEEFKELNNQKYFAEVGNYRGWLYGTPIHKCTNDKVIVVTPSGLRQLKKNPELNIISFYINVPRKDALVKMLQRDTDIDECCRRSLSDVGQFDGIEDEVNFVINNAGYDKTPLELATIIHILAEERMNVNVNTR